jgi:hypothetical protein
MKQAVFNLPTSVFAPFEQSASDFYTLCCNVGIAVSFDAPDSLFQLSTTISKMDGSDITPQEIFDLGRSYQLFIATKKPLKSC